MSLPRGALERRVCRSPIVRRNVSAPPVLRAWHSVTRLPGGRSQRGGRFSRLARRERRAHARLRQQHASLLAAVSAHSCVPAAEAVWHGYHSWVPDVVTDSLFRAVASDFDELWPDDHVVVAPDVLLSLFVWPETSCWHPCVPLVSSWPPSADAVSDTIGLALDKFWCVSLTASSVSEFPVLLELPDSDLWPPSASSVQTACSALLEEHWVEVEERTRLGPALLSLLDLVEFIAADDVMFCQEELDMETLLSLWHLEPEERCSLVPFIVAANIAQSPPEDDGLEALPDSAYWGGYLWPEWDDLLPVMDALFPVAQRRVTVAESLASFQLVGYMPLALWPDWDLSEFWSGPPPPPRVASSVSLSAEFARWLDEEMQSLRATYSADYKLWKRVSRAGSPIGPPPRLLVPPPTVPLPGTTWADPAPILAHLTWFAEESVAWRVGLTVASKLLGIQLPAAHLPLATEAFSSVPR
jgi:hypothetical protein